MIRLLGALVLAGAVSLAAAQRTLPVDRIVAVVNKDVITATELAARVER